MEQITSKYNRAASKEEIRTQIFKEANAHSRAGMYKRWNDDLDCIWRELCADIKEEEFIQKEKEFDNFTKEILKVGEILDSKKGFVPLDKKEIENRNKHYNILMKKEIWLRKLENKLGKGTKWKEEEDY